MTDNEFYIGWQPHAPSTYAKHIKKVVLALSIIVILTGILFAVSSKKFDTGSFEYGSLTEIKGVYLKRPVPSIKVINGKDIFGRLSYITIPLVGFGKSGAEGVIADIEKEKRMTLHQKELTLKGTLLYNDGKALMQIDATDKPVIHVGKEASAALFPATEDLGNLTIRGEIVDPKCYFGVMKPGEGKPHKDCAIRCILGGIPPVLKVMDNKGYQNYYLIVGAYEEKINQAIKKFVAEPVELNARVVKYDDWIVLYLNDSKSMHRISRLQLARPDARVMNCPSPSLKQNALKIKDLTRFQ